MDDMLFLRTVFQTALALAGVLFGFFAFLFATWMGYQPKSQAQRDYDPPRIVNALVNLCRLIAALAMLAVGLALFPLLTFMGNLSVGPAILGIVLWLIAATLASVSAYLSFWIMFKLD